MAILGLLRYAPMSGYSLKKVFDLSVGHFWPAQLSQIYRELGTLEAEGSVVSDLQKQESRPDKRMYSITESGIEKFDEWMNIVPEPLEQPRRSEFMLRVFFGRSMDRKRLIRELEDYIAMLESSKKAIREDRIPDFLKLLSTASASGAGTEMKISPEGEAMYWRFAIHRFDLTAEATIRWAKDCLAELEEST